MKNTATASYENDAGTALTSHATAYTGAGSYDLMVGDGSHPDIQSAVNAASPGESIFVCAGVYRDAVDVNKPVSITGVGTDATILDSAGIFDYGFDITTDNVSITGFTVTRGEGIRLYQSNHSRITGNNITATQGTGIYLGYSDNNHIDNNTINDSTSHNIYLYNSNSNTIANNNVADSRWGNGIDIYRSDNNIFNSNTAHGNHKGFAIQYSGGNTLHNNTLYANTYNFDLTGNQDSHFNNDIDTGNTVDGKPIYYVRNASDTVYDSASNAGTFYCIWCNNITVKNLTLTKNYHGILFWQTNNSLVENITSSSNYYGVYLGKSSSNTIKNNFNSFVNNYYGAYLWYSSSNTLTKSNISNNLYTNIYLYYSDNNTLSSNNASSSTWDNGIYLYYSANNTITGNNASSNGDYGIDLIYSDGNRIDNNTVVDNGILDFYVSNSANTGTDNTCDKPDGWNDEGHIGCTYLSKPLSSYPDFVITNLTWSPYNFSIGQSITLNATVKNIGPANASGSFYVGFYGDRGLIASAWVPALAVNQTVSITRGWYVNRGGANRTLTAKADYDNRWAEYNETNNERTENLPYIPGPDLTISSITWTPDPYSPGTNVEFTVTVQNIGDAASRYYYHYVHFYVDGSYVGNSYYYGSLAPNATFSRTFYKRMFPGNHSVKAVVDSNNYIPEQNESNNSLTLTLPYVDGSDLIISNITWSPANYTPGDTVTFTATVTNIGNISTGNHYEYVGFHVDGSYIGTGYAGYVNIAPGGSVTASRTWTAQGGNHTVKAWADWYGYVYELDESNNQNETPLPYVPTPELIITDVSMPQNYTAGDSIVLNATVENQGSGSWHGSVSVNFYYKNTSYITGKSQTLTLSPGGSGHITATWANAQAGDFYIRALVDASGSIAESNESNNNYYRRSPKVPMPDLNITGIPSQ